MVSGGRQPTMQGLERPVTYDLGHEFGVLLYERVQESVELVQGAIGTEERVVRCLISDWGRKKKNPIGHTITINSEGRDSHLNGLALRFDECLEVLDHHAVAEAEGVYVGEEASGHADVDPLRVLGPHIEPEAADTRSETAAGLLLRQLGEAKHPLPDEGHLRLARCGSEARLRECEEGSYEQKKAHECWTYRVIHGGGRGWVVQAAKENSPPKIHPRIGGRFFH